MDSLQLVVDDHLEIHFVPPPHNRSLMGIFASYVTGENRITTWEQWDEVRERAWAEAAREREEGFWEDYRARSES